MFLPQMDIEDVVATVVGALHPRWSNGILTVSLVLTDQERAEDVFVNLAFERISNYTKVLAADLSESPISPTALELWGLESEHDSGWISGVRIALARAIAHLEAKADGELDTSEVTARFDVFSPPAVYRYAVAEQQSENIWRIGWFQKVSS